MTVKEEKNTTIKNLLKYALIFFALIAITFWLIFKDQDLGEVLQAFGGVKYSFVILGIFLMMIYFIIQSQNVRKILALFNVEISLLKALKFTMIEFFFCAVTPGASGGQPLEIYYMSKEKIPTSKATLAILVQVLDYQIAVMAIGILSQFFLWIVNPAMMSGSIAWLLRIGMIINGAALVILAFCIFSIKTTKKIVDWSMKILARIGIKNIEQKRQAIEKSLDNYQEGANFIKTHPKDFIFSIGRALMQLCVYFLIPCCVYLAFGLSGTSLLQIFAIQSVLFLATSGLPLPGAIGASESVFLTLFGVIFGERFLAPAMLVNRGISFYLFVLVTMLVVMFNAVKLKRKK